MFKIKVSKLALALSMIGLTGWLVDIRYLFCATIFLLVFVELEE